MRRERALSGSEKPAPGNRNPNGAGAPELGSPFGRLRGLLQGQTPKKTPIDMSIGEPRHPFPSFVSEILTQEVAGFGKYPPARGTKDLRTSIGAWLDQRYNLGGKLDFDSSVLPLAGSREGLFLIANIAVERAKARGIKTPVIVLPNPFYQTYASAVQASGAEPFYLSATQATGFLPDLSEITPQVSARLAAIYMCSPANPQGAVADKSYWQNLISIARSNDALVVADECYSEVYRSAPPTGALEAAEGDFDLILSFNSLSKRSNLPGLRAGFVAGDPKIIEPFHTLRNIAAATVPLPVQAVIAALYRNEDHVIKSRELYNQKYHAAEEIFSPHFDYQTPEGGFFLWLNVAGKTAADGMTSGEAMALRLWGDAGVKVIPGSYLTMPKEQGGDRHGDDFVRLALVSDLEDTKTALTRITEVISQ